MTELELNKAYKYSELCEFFQEDAKGGSSKTAQIKKWQQYYDLEKVGSKYLVLKKYDKSELKLTEKHGKFTSYITSLLVQYLAEQESNEITLTYREIFELLWMVNDKYYPAKYGQRAIEQDINYKINPIDRTKDSDKMVATNISMFFNISGRILKGIVNDALASMEKKSLIVANKSFRLFRKVYDNDKGVCYVESHDCTKEEISEILDIQAQAMKLVGISSLSQVFYLDGKNRQVYINYLQEKIQQRFGYDTYAKSWHLILGKQALQKAQTALNKQQLNSNVATRLLTSKEMKLIATTINEQMVDEYIKI